MNERIRELAIQAGVYEGVFTKHGGVPCDLKGYSMLPDEMAKFAELIVRECAEVAANVVAEHEGVDFGLVEKCYKHFGVEE